MGTFLTRNQRFCLIIIIASVSDAAVLPILPFPNARGIRQIIEDVSKPVVSLTNYLNLFTKVLPPFEVPDLASDINSVDAEQLVTDFNYGANNEDIDAHIEDMIFKHFDVETHEVFTEDDYILKLFRIPKDGPPVFLMHGLLGSADDFVIAGRDSALAYLLADEGYDVWMGNARGNKHSRRHKYMRPSEGSFWDFSWHEIGFYDLPATIDYILNSTNQTSLKYIGHSQGTTSFFVLASERPEYNEKVSLMVALSPVAFMEKVRSPVVRLLSPGTSIIHGIMKTFGVYEFLPDTNLSLMLKHLICGTGVVAEILCVNNMFLFVGFDYDQLNVTNLPVVFGHLPSGSSVKQFVHYGQGVLSRDFRLFDYGHSENVERYGEVEPPKYTLENIEVPVALFYSEADWLSHPDDVSRLYQRLKNVVDVYKVPFEEFSHLDFILAKDVKELVYERLLKLLKSF